MIRKNLLAKETLRSTKSSGRRRGRNNRKSQFVFELLEQRRMLTTFTVTNTNNSGPGSLRDAVDMANNTQGPDVIQVDSSLANETINISNGGQIDITSDVRIEGNGVTINAGDQSRIFNVSNDDGYVQQVEIDRVILTGGNSGNDDGGAIRNEEDLTITNSAITGNTGSTGGAIFSTGTDNILRVVDSTIQNNSATSDGGAIAVRTPFGYGNPDGYPGTHASIENSTIQNNTAGDEGGAVHTYGDDAGVTIQNTTITGNSAAQNGGAISSDESSVDVLQSDISGNTAGGSGGGINSYQSELNVHESTISGNTAVNDGGGINSQDDEVVVGESQVTGNTAKTGGGVSGAISEINLVDSTISSNTTTGIGGASEGQGGGGFFAFTILSIVRAFIVNNSSTGAGAGIQISYGSDATVQESTITGNESDQSGGGIGVDGASNVYVGTTQFYDNYAHYFGGAIDLSELTPPGRSSVSDARDVTISGSREFSDDRSSRMGSAQVTITGTTIGNNVADTFGGAVRIGEGRVVQIEHTAIFDNDASRGGGIFNDGELDCVNCTLTGNTASSFGGGIFFENESTGTISESLLQNNSAGSQGGAVNLDNDANVSIDRTTLADNSAARGGALYGALNSDYTITNSTISGNSATEGGAAYLRGGEGLVQNSTVANNEADRGGGIFANSLLKTNIFESVTLAGNTASDQGGGFFVDNTFGLANDFIFENSIVADNTAANGGNDLFNSNEFDFLFDNSLLEDTSGATISGTGNITGLDPQLGPLEDNGGPTLTMLLEQDSPAIDAGDPAAVAGQNGTPLFDQRGPGFDRVKQGRLDMGAVEFGVDVLPPQVESVVINGGDVQRSMVMEITVTFTEAVTGVDANAFILMNTTSNTQILPTVTTEIVQGKTVATLTFPNETGGSLTDGDYTLTTLDTITDVSGNQLDGDGDGNAGGNAVDDFFRLFGDINGDSNVNAVDLFEFRLAFKGTYNAAFDYNGDGVINIIDLFQFRIRFDGS